MEFSIERAALLKAVAQAQSVVERRNTIPILSNVLLRADGNTLHLKATDLDLEVFEKTPAVVERIVIDIDSIVRVVRFLGWQRTNQGERKVQKALRKPLLKYKLHKDQSLFERAYAYIKEYY